MYGHHRSLPVLAHLFPTRGLADLHIGAPWREARAAVQEQPPTQLPLPSNAMVRSLSGRCTGTVVAAMKAAVLLPSFTLPPVVASSLACEAITDAGFTNSLMTKAASVRSEEHTSELQSLMRISYAVFCLKKKK